jgi:hypothetical protein
MPLSADIARLRVLEPTAERQWVRLVDFGELDHEGRCWISQSIHPGPRLPNLGEHLYMLDADGRGCLGTVELVEGWQAAVRPDWRTWTG